MACSGTYCNQNCTCNGGYCICNTKCTGGYYAVGTRGTISFTDPVLSTSLLVRYVHIDQLRYQVDQERIYRAAKYGTTPWSWSYAYPLPVPSTIRGPYWTQIRDALNNIPGYTDVTDTYTASQLVSALKLKKLRDTVIAMRADCVCNTDCNAYTTCSCYNNCGCHNDCGCNYSDRDLKTDIEYF